MRSSARYAIAAVAILSLGAVLGRPATLGAAAVRLSDNAVAMFVSDAATSSIFALDSRGKIVRTLKGCDTPEGMKVDHNGNLWVACHRGASIAEYRPGATTPSLTLLVRAAGGNPFNPIDVAVDPLGNVYASTTFFYYCDSICHFYPPVITYWTPKDVKNLGYPSGLVADPNLKYQAYYLDAANPDHLYVDYAKCTGSSGCNHMSCASSPSQCEYGLDEISNPQARRHTVKTIIAPGSAQLGFPGGVYVSNGGTILNTVDQQQGIVDRWTLPGLSPLSKLGPTPQNRQHTCAPASGGFNKDDSVMALADGGCRAVDLGNVSQNIWRARGNPSFMQPAGAAFIPSDK
jgi:hypothetical protein